MKGTVKKAAAGLTAAVLLLVAGAYGTVRTESFMQEAGSVAESVVASSLGTNVEIGSIEVSSLHELTLHDIKVYDKQAECMARADEAQVGFRLLAAFNAPADSLQKVTLKGVEAMLEERADGSWNVQDLIADSKGDSKIHALFQVEDAKVTVKSPRLPESVTFTQVQGSLDCADYPVMKAEGTARHGEAELEFGGTLGSSRQIVRLKARNADLENYLKFLPEGVLPEEVVLEGGTLEEAEATVVYQGGIMSLVGSGRVEDGRLQALGTEVEHINGGAFFTDSQIMFDGSAEAAGQKVMAHGKVDLLEGKPYLDFEAKSDSFDPSKIMTDIPYRGAAEFTAHVKGMAANPLVVGKVKVAEGEAYGLSFSQAEAEVRYEEGRIYAQKVTAKTLGGSLQGEAELEAGNLAFTGHVKAEGIDLSRGAATLPGVEALSELSGSVSADVSFSGLGNSTDSLEAYGSLKLTGGSFRGLPIERAGASFALQGENLDIDFLSARLPNHGDVGLEGRIGNIYGQREIAMDFYGGHVELSLLQNLLPQADMSGVADFRGTLRGSVDNPQVDLDLSATRGALFKQPYDSVSFNAAGSLDGVAIKDFSMEKDGKQTWYVDGVVGLTGAKRIDLRADTVGVRMEDLAALVAPDQPITGNVDNTIHFTGTLDNPQAVGYIHFYLGSYMGVLLSGMDGDYYLQDGKVRLQDFHIYSPMVDMDVNGTVDRAGRLDLLAEVHDIDMKRIQHKLPYEVSGHGTFSGRIGGSISAPVFHGMLDAPLVVLNGQEIHQVHGMVDYQNHRISLSNFGFSQGESGYCGLELSYGTDNQTVSGNALVQNFDIQALCDILNQHNDKLAGHISVGAQLGGTWQEPDLWLQGSIPDGQAAGYDVQNVALKGHLSHKVLFLDELSGSQGAGSFAAHGTIDFNNEGEIAAKLSAKDLSLGMFTGLSGIKAQVSGTADVEASFGGYLKNPSADVSIMGRDGGVEGSTFDTLETNLQVRNGLCDIKNMLVKKTVGEKTYQASARGIVPSRALEVDNPAELNDYEQIRLEISLDNADLSLLPALSKQVDWAMGPTQGNLLITGTAAHPHFDGNVLLTDGAVKLKALKLPLTKMSAKIVFNGNQMTVKDFFGTMGEGSYEGSGRLELDGLTPLHYSFDFRASGLEVQSSFFTGPLDGEIHLSEGKLFDREMPKLSGRLDLHDCTVSVPSIPDTEGELPDMILDLQLNVGKKVHFYSSYLYDMYLKGAVHFGGTTHHPKTSGQVEVARGGTVSYLKTPFKIRQGVAYFNQVDSFLPSLDFVADTTVGRTKIYLYLHGPLGAMETRLGSSPSLSQTEIMQVLTLGSDYAAGNSTLTAGDMLSLGLQMTVLSELENAVRKVLFLDYFSVHRGGPMSDFVSSSSESNGEDDEYSVEVGKYVTRKLMLKFSQGIGGKHKQRYGVEYNFDDRFSLVFEQEGSESIVGFTSRIQF